jgi:hypothetical protein
VAYNRIVKVEMRENGAHLGEDVLCEIDHGGIFYINSEKEVFIKREIGHFLSGIHGHDNEGNKYQHYRKAEKGLPFYEKNLFLLDMRIDDIRAYAH